MMLTTALLLTTLATTAARDPVPARLVSAGDLDRFVAATRPTTDATAAPSPAPPSGTFP